MWRASAWIALLGLLIYTAVAAQTMPASLPAAFAREGVECTAVQSQRAPLRNRGRVQVLEVFSYGCGHCYRMEPHLKTWLQTKPEGVDFVRVHVPGRGANAGYARLFYTLQALGRLDLHEKIFARVFEQLEPLSAPTEAEAFKLQAAFAAEHGIDAHTFAETYRSLAVSQELLRARDLLRDYQVDSTPTLLINGKYRVLMTALDHEANVFALVSDVVAHEQGQPARASGVSSTALRDGES